MKASDFPESTHVLGKPDSMGEAECSPLPVHVCRDAPHPYFVSCWVPDEEDRARIAAGGPVWLYVISSVHPPVAVRTDPPFSTPEAQA